jgi:hypothetical protein
VTLDAAGRALFTLRTPTRQAPVRLPRRGRPWYGCACPATGQASGSARTDPTTCNDISDSGHQVVAETAGLHGRCPVSVKLTSGEGTDLGPANWIETRDPLWLTLAGHFVEFSGRVSMAILKRSGGVISSRLAAKPDPGTIMDRVRGPPRSDYGRDLGLLFLRENFPLPDHSSAKI